MSRKLPFNAINLADIDIDAVKGFRVGELIRGDDVKVTTMNKKQ